MDGIRLTVILRVFSFKKCCQRQFQTIKNLNKYQLIHSTNKLKPVHMNVFFSELNGTVYGTVVPYFTIKSLKLSEQKCLIELGYCTCITEENGDV